VGTLAFVVWAPPSFLGVPLAALLLAARPGTQRGWATALLVAASSVAWLAVAPRDQLSVAAYGYNVLVAAAFLAFVLLAPARFFTQALRASVVALVLAAVLARVMLGSLAAEVLHAEATRQVTSTLGAVMALRPETAGLFGPSAQIVSATVPAFLVLQTLAGLGLAWQWHQQLAPRPLGAPLAPFSEFRFGDGWVWAVVAAVAVWVTPVVAGLKGAALNLLVVLGALYLLRGAAIAVASAGALGLSSTALVVGLAVSAALAVPLLLIVPGLATLGMTDTWLEFRRRLAGRPNGS
jgi:hypothetical protein